MSMKFKYDSGSRVRFDKGYRRSDRDLGVTKKVSVTMRQSDWDMIAKEMKERNVRSMSDYFRNLHAENRKNLT